MTTLHHYPVKINSPLTARFLARSLYLNFLLLPTCWWQFVVTVRFIFVPSQEKKSELWTFPTHLFVLTLVLVYIVVFIVIVLSPFKRNWDIKLGGQINDSPSHWKFELFVSYILFVLRWLSKVTHSTQNDLERIIQEVGSTTALCQNGILEVQSLEVTYDSIKLFDTSVT